MAPMAIESEKKENVVVTAVPVEKADKIKQSKPKMVVGSAISTSTDGVENHEVPKRSSELNDIQYAPEYAPLSTPYQVLQQYHSKPTKVRVACIGAGAGGLCVIYKMGRMFEPGTWELTVYEKNNGVGGTWKENRYPGVACDTPSSLYTYSWEPKWDWSHYYAYGPEIRQYFEDFADKHGCREFIKFNSRIIEGRWNDETGHWSIVVEDQTTKERYKDWCHVLINAAGILNNWKWPDVEGLHDFEGPKVHSANWDETVDFKDKTVGLIGNGSTGIQIVPVLQREAKHMTVFMRSPTWISSPFGTSALESDIRQGKNIDSAKRQHEFTEEEKARFRDDPEYYLTFRKRLEAEFNSIIQVFQPHTPEAKGAKEAIKKEMLLRIGDGPRSEELKKLLIPTWSPGCRRLSPGDNYLEALSKPNVRPLFGPLKRVTKDGILTEAGELVKVDVIVCATGFKPAFRPAFPLYNQEGKSLDDDWGPHVNLYLGVSAPRFPNYFTIAGPGSTWAAGSLLPSIEAGVEYALKITKKIQQEHIRSIEVRQEAVDDLFEHFDAFHAKTVFQEECRSWYKDGKIKNRIYQWPGGTIHHVKTIMQPRFEDYRIKYRYGNRFSYLGNGEVKANLTGDVEGLSSYIRSSDHEWTID